MTNMDWLGVAATLHAEKPKDDGCSGQAKACWEHMVDTFALRVGALDERAAFKRACGLEEERS